MKGKQNKTKINAYRRLVTEYVYIDGAVRCGAILFVEVFDISTTTVGLLSLRAVSDLNDIVAIKFRRRYLQAILLCTLKNICVRHC